MMNVQWLARTLGSEAPPNCRSSSAPSISQLGSGEAECSDTLQQPSGAGSR